MLRFSVGLYVTSRLQRGGHMSELNSAGNYRGREQQERARATACIDPAIAAIHVEMAERYAALVMQADPQRRPRPKLRLAT